MIPKERDRCSSYQSDIFDKRYAKKGYSVSISNQNVMQNTQNGEEESGTENKKKTNKEKRAEIARLEVKKRKYMSKLESIQ